MHGCMICDETAHPALTASFQPPAPAPGPSPAHQPAEEIGERSISWRTLAASKAAMYSLRRSTGMTVHGQPAAASITFIRNRPMRPLPSG